MTFSLTLPWLINSHVSLLYIVVRSQPRLNCNIWCHESVWLFRQCPHAHVVWGTQGTRMTQVTAPFPTPCILDYCVQHRLCLVRCPSSGQVSFPKPMGVSVEFPVPFWCSWKQRSLQSPPSRLQLVCFTNNNLQQFPTSESFCLLDSTSFGPSLSSSPH